MQLISCSWHQTTKPRILFSPIFSQFKRLKQKTNFYLVQKWEKNCFGPIKSLVSFSTAQTEKNSWQKLGETRFVVWWFDVTNKIYIFCQFLLFWSELKIHQEFRLEFCRGNSFQLFHGYKICILKLQLNQRIKQDARTDPFLSNITHAQKKSIVLPTRNASL